MTATAEAITVNEAEHAELKAGAERILGCLKNAGRLNSPLEFEIPARDTLEAQREKLITLLADEPAGKVRLPTDVLYAGRVAARLRHRQLVNLQAKDERGGVAENPNTHQRIATCERLGKKFGIQLDIIEHSEEEEGEE